MKFQFALIVLTAAIFQVNSAFACSPPRRSVDMSAGEIQTILRDENVLNKLDSLGIFSVSEIKSTKDGYAIVGANGCYVIATIKYSYTDHPGMCPTPEGVRILKEACPK